MRNTRFVTNTTNVKIPKKIWSNLIATCCHDKHGCLFSLTTVCFHGNDDLFPLATIFSVLPIILCFLFLPLPSLLSSNKILFWIFNNSMVHSSELFSIFTPVSSHNGVRLSTDLWFIILPFCSSLRSVFASVEYSFRNKHLISQWGIGLFESRWYILSTTTDSTI